jgi:hypothetical protein
MNRKTFSNLHIDNSSREHDNLHERKRDLINAGLKFLMRIMYKLPKIKKCLYISELFCSLYIKTLYCRN